MTSEKSSSTRNNSRSWPACVWPLLHLPAPPPPTANRPAEIDCRRPQCIPVWSAAPSEAGAFASEGIPSEPHGQVERNRLQLPAAIKEIGRSVYF